MARSRTRKEVVPRSPLEGLRDEVAEGRQTLQEQVDEILKGYENRIDQAIEETKKRVVEEEYGFAEAVQGSKGTGQQKSRVIRTLRQMRQFRGLTLREMADQLGIPYPHLSEIERGLRFPLGPEREHLERWAGGQLSFAMVPYVEIRHDDEE